MASANREPPAQSGPSTAGPHTLNSMQRQRQQQQQQQQELIKLLAQHFHHQFYQLASTNNVSAQQQQIPRALLSAYQHHQLTSQYPNDLVVGEMAGFDLSGRSSGSGGDMNLAQSHHERTLQTNHQIRSQPPAGQQQQQHTSAATSLAHSSLGQESLMEFAINQQEQQQNCGANLPPPPLTASAYSTTSTTSLNDMNLFNALGLNLASPQLVLSLHQQSLIQAAAAARQYELRKRMGEEDPPRYHHNQHHHQHLQHRRNSDEAMNDNSNHNLLPENALGDDNHEQSSDSVTNAPPDRTKELQQQLKFSINTILGRGSSPRSFIGGVRGAGIGGEPALKPTKASPYHHHHHHHNNQTLSATNNLMDNHKLFKMEFNDSNDEQQRGGTINAATPDCDPNESGSDSSSINASITPLLPQTAANVAANVLFNTTGGHVLPPDHRSATNLNLNTQANHPALVLGQSDHHLRGHGQHVAAQQQQQQQHHHPNQHHHPMQPAFLAGSTAFPWTVAARGKPRRGMMRRAVFSDSQRVGLEKRFQLQKYISKPDRKKLAEKLGLRDSQVKIWFQNRRMKWRNSKERELLSAGGSREQTLPNRNNPNPDLSDVGETLKRLTAPAATTPIVAALATSTTTTTTNSGGNNLTANSSYK